MAKGPTITTIASGYYSRTALNDNFTNIDTAFDNTLSLDGSTPNSMGADLDLNNNDILNGGTLNATEVVVGGISVAASAAASAASASAASTSADEAAVSASDASDSEIAAAQSAALAEAIVGLDQGVSTTDSPTFAGLTATTADINGGTIDGTVIGGAAPAAVTGTTLTATGAFTSLGIDDNATSTAITIDASENVGIGTASPLAELHVATSTTDYVGDVMISGTRPSIVLDDTTAAQDGFYIGSDGGTLSIGHGDLSTGAYGAATERMRIVGGTSTLMFNTTIDDDSVEGVRIGSRLNVTGGAAGAALLNRQGSDGTLVTIRRSNVTVGTITVTASTTAYNTTSDYRLKENVEPIQGAGDIIKAMQPVTYNFKANKGEWQDGFLAHELQTLYPYAVTGEKDKTKEEEYEIEPEEAEVLDEDGKVVKPAKKAKKGTRTVDDLQMVDYSKLTPLLTAALQEALGKIEALETRLAALEAL